MRTTAAIWSCVLLIAGCKGPGNVTDPTTDPDAEDCIPLTCEVAGKSCGDLPNGCGGVLSCGSTCPGGQTCGGGGTANVCGAGTCVPTTCEARGKNCGMISDGCSAVLPCGTCTLPEFCGGSGTKNVCGQDGLASATGCAGVFNPDQMLDLRLTMAASDWTAVVADTTYTDVRPATFQCNADPALSFQVGVRKKRSGAIGGKPGLKIDFNSVVPGSDWHTLKKLSLENGISEGSAEGSLHDLVAEYLAWRLMARSGAHSSRAVFVRLFVNGAFIGTYVNVEQVDRRFLRSRLGDDTGWLVKLSGGVGDGPKTNSTQPNPYAQYLCFWEKNGGQSCTTPTPEQMLTYLPEHLDITQMLRFGSVNAVIANADAPFIKDNNYYTYDWTQPRLYIPWDLDTVMKNDTPLFGASGSTLYTSVLFTHWEDDYDAELTRLLAGPLALAEIQTELDRALALAGAALEADPTLAGQSAADEISAIRAYWSTRHPSLVSQVETHAP